MLGRDAINSPIHAAPISGCVFILFFLFFLFPVHFPNGICFFRNQKEIELALLSADGRGQHKLLGVEMRRSGSILSTGLSLLSTQDIAILDFCSLPIPALITSLLLPLPLQPLEQPNTPCLFRSET